MKQSKQAKDIVATFKTAVRKVMFCSSSYSCSSWISSIFDLFTVLVPPFPFNPIFLQMFLLLLLPIKWWSVRDVFVHSYTYIPWSQLWLHLLSSICPTNERKGGYWETQQRREKMRKDKTNKMTTFPLPCIPVCLVHGLCTRTRTRFNLFHLLFGGNWNVDLGWKEADSIRRSLF